MKLVFQNFRFSVVDIDRCGKVFEEDRIRQRRPSLLETSWEGIAMHVHAFLALHGFTMKHPHWGVWTLKPRPKEEMELAHLYERREFPYPGDAEAMEEFIAKGGMTVTTIVPKG